jgi:hypothetical protein
MAGSSGTRDPEYFVYGRLARGSTALYPQELRNSAGLQLFLVLDAIAPGKVFQETEKVLGREMLSNTD